MHSETCLYSKQAMSMSDQSDIELSTINEPFLNYLFSGKNSVVKNKMSFNKVHSLLIEDLRLVYKDLQFPQNYLKSTCLAQYCPLCWKLTI